MSTFLNPRLRSESFLNRSPNQLSMAQRKTLNRALLIVTPKQPSYDWVDEVFAGREVDVMDECWSGLIDQDWEIKELERFLKANHEMIFEDLLAGMCS